MGEPRILSFLSLLVVLALVLLLVLAASRVVRLFCNFGTSPREDCSSIDDGSLECVLVSGRGETVAGNEVGPFVVCRELRRAWLSLMDKDRRRITARTKGGEDIHRGQKDGRVFRTNFMVDCDSSRKSLESLVV